MRARVALIVAVLLLIGAVPVVASLLPLADAPAAAFSEMLSLLTLGLVGRTALLGLVATWGALLSCRVVLDGGGTPSTMPP